MRIIGNILGLYRDNGKENGNYNNGVIYIYIGFKVQGSGKYTEISTFPRSKLLGKGLRVMQNV